MPHLTVNGVRLFYEEAGGGSQTLVLVHGLMLASESWEAQRDYFSRTHRVITFDLRGQGRSDKPRHGLDLDSLARDLEGLIEALDAGPCHLVGFSMGTFVAMRTAIHRPDLVSTLTLVGPSADAEEPENLPRYRFLIAWVRLFGPHLLAGPLMRILFGDSYLRDPDRAAGRDRWKRYVQALPRALYRAAAASAGRASILLDLGRITAPTLVMSGEEDRPISPARARKVQATIPGARFLAFEKTGHAVMIEQPVAFNTALDDFLRGQGA